MSSLYRINGKLARVDGKIGSAVGGPLTDPTPVRMRTVGSGAELTKVLANDSPADGLTLTAGDCLVLTANVTYTGPFTLPVVSGATSAAPCFIRSADYTPGSGGWPDKGRRVGPSHATLMARILTPVPIGANDASCMALKTAPYAHHWRVEGVFIQADAETSTPYLGFYRYSQALFWIRGADDGVDGPDHIWIRHCLVRGHDVYGAYCGLRVDADELDVKDCHFDQFYAAVPFGGVFGTAASEGQVIELLHGTNLRVENCSLSGAMETLWMGGGTWWSHTTNVTATKCYITKPEWFYDASSKWGTSDSTLSWSQGWAANGTDLICDSVTGNPDDGYYHEFRSPGQPFTSADVSKGLKVAASTGWTGSLGRAGRISAVTDGVATVWRANQITTAEATGGIWYKDAFWAAKNIWEFKGGSNLLTEGCILDTFYQSAQGHMVASVISDSTFGVRQDLVFRNSIFCKFPKLSSVQNYDVGESPNEPNRGWTLDNVLCLDWGIAYDPGGSALFLEHGNAQDVHVQHVTVWGTGGTALMVNRIADDAIFSGFILRDSIMLDTSNYSSPVASGSEADPKPWGSWCSDSYAGTPDWQIHHNAFVNADDGYGARLWTADNTPVTYEGWPKPESTYHNTIHAGLATFAAAHFENAATGDFRLQADSTLKGTASDDTDPGCDLDALYAALSPDDYAWVAANYPGIAPA